MSQLIVFPNSGFANRLKSLVSASLLDRDFRVYWPPENFCGLGYADIFSDTFREIDHIPAGSTLLNTWRFELPATLRNLLPRGFSDCSTGYKGIDFPGDKESRTIDFEFLKIPRQILAELKEQFAQLRFTEEITTRVNAMLRDLPENYLGVHARTWVDEPERYRNWFDFNDFVKACSCFRDKELFVSSDDPAFIKKLSIALNRSLITTKGADQRAPKPWHQNSREEMLDDIVELLVLANASQLMLTAMSTYSEVAWFIGGCTEEVYFADPAFRYKGNAGHCAENMPSIGIGSAHETVKWLEIAGTPSYFLALLPGRHLHLDGLGDGAHRIGDYVEKYRGYMKGSAVDDYMIDVGANLGLSTFPVASMPRRVVAFEPVPDNVAAMKQSMNLNCFDNVTLVPCAVSSEVGEAALHVPLGRADNTSFGKDVANANVSSPEVHQILVPTETIDHWFAAHASEFPPRNARLLKIDVQGYETAVFSGARDFIAACRPFEKLVVEFEFDPKLTTMAGYSLVALLELVHSFGLDIYHNNTLIPSEYYGDFCEQNITCDLIALFQPATGSERSCENSIFTITNNAGIVNRGDSMYGQDFYDGQIFGSLQSAQVYLYHLFSLWGVPHSVVDVGCGRGAWLATCRDFGVKRTVGIDGDWNSQEAMIDPAIEFHAANLEKRFPLNDRFDLAISLEVAEHLQPGSSEDFVESLASLSDAVLFGAAFSGQPGVNHVNTRPHSFWAKQFFSRGYLLFDLFRPAFWNDDRVEPCYRQNTFLYVKPCHPLHDALVSRGFSSDANSPLIDAVHPLIYLGLLNEYNKFQQPPTAPLPHAPPVPPSGSLTETHKGAADETDAVKPLIDQASGLEASNRLDDAAHTYRMALVQHPDNPECLLRLSYLLLRTKHYEESLHHARHFLRIVDDISFGHYLAGHAAREAGRWDESRSHLLRAVELDPTHVYARVLCCMSSFTVCRDQAETLSVMRTYTDELDCLVRNTPIETPEQITNAVNGIGALAPFFLPYLGHDVTRLQEKYGAWVCSVMAARYPQFAQPLPRRSSSDRIKIGIISSYFCKHSNWKIPIKGWMEQLDRKLFSVHCFHTGDTTDPATETARSLADSFFQSSDIDALAPDIHRANFDLLIYPGIGMDTVTLKLAALRLAPVQCASWGHPVTTGLPTVDYYFSSDLMEPLNGDQHYTEKLVRLPNLSVWCEPDEHNAAPSSNLIIQGLAADDVMFLCCQNILKYLPQHDSVFPTIAAQAPNARFVFIASHVSELTEKFVQRLEAVFQDRSMVAGDHVTFMPYLNDAEFAALNARADIFLDSIGWSGCNTIFESLPFNTPIVTLPGAFMRGRHAYAILRMMGIEDTVAANMDDYVSIAVRLARDEQWRKEISARISLNKHLVYRDRECVAELERFIMTVSGRSDRGDQ